MKRTTLLVVAFAVVATTMFGARVASAAALACDATTGVPGAGECQITTAHAVTGAVEVDRTLHIFGNGRLDASGVGGITLRVCVAPAPAFSTCDLIMDTPTVVNGGQIEADDTTGSAFPIDIAVSRDVLMNAQSKILSENVASGGSGNNITIVAGRDMTLGASAKISASKVTGSGGTGKAGNITITVGDVVGHTSGVFTMGPSTAAVPGEERDPGEQHRRSAGAIAISAGKEMHIGGLVESFSGLSGTGGQPPGGGPITVVSGCKLIVEDTAKISSEGQDPGADLVHLEGCDVLIQGLVQSIAPGAGHVRADRPAEPLQPRPDRAPDDPRRERLRRVRRDLGQYGHDRQHRHAQGQGQRGRHTQPGARLDRHPRAGRHHDHRRYGGAQLLRQRRRVQWRQCAERAMLELLCRAGQHQVAKRQGGHDRARARHCRPRGVGKRRRARRQGRQDQRRRRAEPAAAASWTSRPIRSWP